MKSGSTVGRVEGHCARSKSDRPLAAFTFVEALISLMICAVLIGAVCAALIHVAQMEKRAAILRQTPLLLQTLACRTYLAQESPREIAAHLPGDWLAESEDLSEGDESTRWLIWRLSPGNDVSLVYPIAIRSAEAPW